VLDGEIVAIGCPPSTGQYVTLPGQNPPGQGRMHATKGTLVRTTSGRPGPPRAATHPPTSMIDFSANRKHRGTCPVRSNGNGIEGPSGRPAGGTRQEDGTAAGLRSECAHQGGGNGRRLAVTRPGGLALSPTRPWTVRLGPPRNDPRMGTRLYPRRHELGRDRSRPNISVVVFSTDIKGRGPAHSAPLNAVCGQDFNRARPDGGGARMWPRSERRDRDDPRQTSSAPS